MSAIAAATAPRRAVGAGLWVVLVLATGALLAAGLWLRDLPLMEAWLFAFVMLFGLVTGSLGLLMIGHLLGDPWLDPIRGELEPASLTMPFIALLAIPLALDLPALYPWARGEGVAEVPARRLFFLSPDFFLARSALYLVLWIALAAIVARAGPHKGASALGIALIAPTVSLAAIDWIMSRDPYWWSSLFGFSFAVSQLTAALAAAFLITMARRDHPDPERMESLERAMLTFALLNFWVWFSQFLIVWMANIPDEVQWYLVRMSGWSLWSYGIGLATLSLAILLLIPAHARRGRLVFASALILVQYFAHMLWLLRPSAARPELTWLDLIIPVAIGGVWAFWFLLVVGARARPG